MKTQFKNGDKLRYIKNAPEDAGMQKHKIGMTGTFMNGIFRLDDGTANIPLKGIYNITKCFEIIEPSKTNP